MYVCKMPIDIAAYATSHYKAKIEIKRERNSASVKDSLCFHTREDTSAEKYDAMSLFTMKAAWMC